MNTDPRTENPVVGTLLHDPSGDAERHVEEKPHDPAEEVAHAWEHFWENARFFACFLSVIFLTVIAFNINFGHRGNWVAIFVLAAARCALIAYFLATLFKSFSFVFRTLFFTAIFLSGMVFLSWWDSELRGIGDPIKDRINHISPDNVP